MDNRKVEEAQFHDTREQDRLKLSNEEFQRRYSNKKFYSITGRSREFVSAWLQKNCQGKRVLDYCCGLGEVSQRLANYGASVYGMDISEESLKTASKRLNDSGLGVRASFQVMDAEGLAFGDEMFDVIVCSGVLHHLDMERAYPELSRVLKADGKVICIEALGHNPLIQRYRRRTPHLRTPWETEHILKQRDAKKALKWYHSLEIKYFHLFSICAVPFRNTFFFRPLLGFLDAVDAIVLRIPYIQLMAWQMVFVLSDPKK